MGAFYDTPPMQIENHSRSTENSPFHGCSESSGRDTSLSPQEGKSNFHALQIKNIPGLSLMTSQKTTPLPTKPPEQRSYIQWV